MGNQTNQRCMSSTQTGNLTNKNQRCVRCHRELNQQNFGTLRIWIQSVIWPNQLIYVYIYIIYKLTYCTMIFCFIKKTLEINVIHITVTQNLQHDIVSVRSTPRPVTADKWFSFKLPFQNEHKEIAPKISARRCPKKMSTCPPNPWYRIQNSRQGLHFQNLSSISVAFQHWEKKSADFHVLPWEGASKAFASKQGLEHVVKELGRLMQLAQCTIMCWSMESDWPCGKIAMFL